MLRRWALLTIVAEPDTSTFFWEGKVDPLHFSEIFKYLTRKNEQILGALGRILAEICPKYISL